MKKRNDDIYRVHDGESHTEGFPLYSKTEAMPEEAMLIAKSSPLYKLGDTEIFEAMQKVLAENHRKRQQGMLKTMTLTELETKIDVYYQLMSLKKKLPTPAGLCASIGINHKELLRSLKDHTPEGKALQDALEVMHAIYQEGVLEGVVPVKTYTFMAKNYWGMTDKEIIEVQGENGVINIAEVDAKYNRLTRLSNLQTQGRARGDSEEIITDVESRELSDDDVDLT